MAVSGSRERLCIRQTIRNRSPEDLQEQEQQPKLNDACQSRMSLIVELEIPKLCERNYGNRKQTSSHNEDDPPTNLERDTTEAPQQQQQKQQGDGNEHDEQERDGDWIDPNSRNKPSCPNYRQLTDDDSRTAQKTFAQIVLQATSTGIVLAVRKKGRRQGLVRAILKTWLPLMVRTRLSNEVLRYMGVNRSHPLEWALKRILKRISSKLETFTRVVLYKGKEPSN
jgi:hypothetical protein